jgi:four helix bundle protein
MSKSYKDLEIYKISLQLFFKSHELSKRLPKHELYELGSQIRRSSDSIVSNIVEGYGRRTYKQEFLRFLIFSHASNMETISHLEKIKILYPALNDSLI